MVSIKTVLEVFREACKRTKGIKTHDIVSNKLGGVSMAFIDTEADQAYVIAIYPVTSIIRVEKPLMYSDVIKEGE